MYAYLLGDFNEAYAALSDAVDSGVGTPGAELLAATSAVQLGDVDRGMVLLERVVESDIELPDELMLRYAPPGNVRLSLELTITPGVPAVIQLDSVGAVLLLTELYQAARRREPAIDLVSQLLDLEQDNEATRLSLCDLRFEDADFAAVVRTAVGTTPLTDLGFACHIFKGQAEGWMGDWQAARSTLESALEATRAESAHLHEVGHNVLAETYHNLGLSELAEKERERALVPPESRPDAASDPRMLIHEGAPPSARSVQGIIARVTEMTEDQAHYLAKLWMRESDDRREVFALDRTQVARQFREDLGRDDPSEVATEVAAAVAPSDPIDRAAFIDAVAAATVYAAATARGIDSDVEAKERGGSPDMVEELYIPWAAATREFGPHASQVSGFLLRLAKMTTEQCMALAESMQSLDLPSGQPWSVSRGPSPDGGGPGIEHRAAYLAAREVATARARRLLGHGPAATDAGIAAGLAAEAIAAQEVVGDGSLGSITEPLAAVGYPLGATG